MPEPGTPSPDPISSDLDALLARSRDGDEEALGDLIERMHDELREVARRLMRREGAGHTLQPTALVHEAYLKLAGGRSLPWQDRGHFLAICARAMRQVLVRHAERNRAEKRGGGRRRTSLEAASMEAALLDGLSGSPLLGATPHAAVESAWRIYEQRSLDLLALDTALEKLARLDPRQARIVELRFFGGLSVPEAAEAIGCSPRTIEREWRTARAWLRLQIADEPPRSGSGETGSEEGA